MTQHIAEVKSYSWYHFGDHGRYWSAKWVKVQLPKSIKSLDQLASIELEMDLGSMDNKREHHEQNFYILGDI